MTDGLTVHSWDKIQAVDVDFDDVEVTLSRQGESLPS